MKNMISFRYTDGSFGLFKTWREMVEFWAPYYESKADADRYLRKVATAAMVSADGEPITEIKADGPVSYKVKRRLLNQAKAL